MNISETIYEKQQHYSCIFCQFDFELQKQVSQLPVTWAEVMTTSRNVMVMMKQSESSTGQKGYPVIGSHPGVPKPASELFIALECTCKLWPRTFVDKLSHVF